MSNAMTLANEDFPRTTEQRSLFDETMQSIALKPIDSKVRSAIALSKYPWLAQLSFSQTRAFPNEFVFDWYRVTPFKNLDFMVARVLPVPFYKEVLDGGSGFGVDWDDPRPRSATLNMGFYLNFDGIDSISHNADHDRVARLGTAIAELANRFYRPWA
jgi:hypothetical protein